MSRPVEYETKLQNVVLGTAERRNVLFAVAEQNLPDCWLAAGFVRNTVWDYLHGYDELTPLNDVDVAYFDPMNIDRGLESAVADSLGAKFPGLIFSVKNQARMHLKNGHPPYTSATEAISRWTETCTAVGVRWTGHMEICAPHGLADLFELIIRPTFDGEEYFRLVRARIQERHWLSQWPYLRVDMTPSVEGGSR